MAVTKLANLINPEVMADMISGKLPKKIRFTPFARIDRTLAGVPGDTITVPRFAYIGDAEDVAEGVAMGTTTLTSSSTQAKVKKAGKAVEITDEAVLSGYGNPVGEAGNQLLKSIAAKIDNDCETALAGASLIYDGTAGIISYNGIVSGVDLFQEEGDSQASKVMFVHPKQITQIRKDSDFKDRNKYPLNVVMDGVIGEIGGCQIIPSKKVEAADAVSAVQGVYTVTIGGTVASGDVITVAGVAITLDGTSGASVSAAATAVAAGTYANYSTSASAGVVTFTEKSGKQGTGVPTATITSASGTVAVATTTKGVAACVACYKDIIIITSSSEGESDELPALTIYMKRDVNVESDRDILKKTTVASADEHYTAVLSNESKVVVAKYAQTA